MHLCCFPEAYCCPYILHSSRLRLKRGRVKCSSAVVGLVLVRASKVTFPCSLQDQLGRMALLSGLLLVTVSLGTDGIPPLVQTRTPPPAMSSLPDLPAKLGGYSYVMWKLGPFQLTRKGLTLGITAACLSFTVSS